MTPEGKVKREIRKILDEWGVEYFMPVAGLTVGGVSDFIGCFNGRFIAIEAKADTRDQPTPLQRMFLARIASAGGVALIIHVRNLNVLTSLLHSIAKSEMA